MPLIIDPEHLKTVARLTTRIKDVSSTPKRGFFWNGVHRLQAEAGRLRLDTTDGKTFLEWPISAEGQDDFDVLVDAGPFNALVSRLGFGAYVIGQAPGHLTLTSDSQVIQIPTREQAEYPTRPDDHTHEATDEARARAWRTPARPLAKALEFLGPLVNAENPNPARSVASWTEDGCAFSGNPRCLGFVRGLPRPEVATSFTQATARGVSAFLSEVENDVTIRTDGAVVIFLTDAGHSLVVPSEDRHFQFARAVEGVQDLDDCLVDAGTIRHALDLIDAILPRGVTRVDARLRGAGEAASLRIEANGSGPTRFSDDFDVVRTRVPSMEREIEDARPKDTVFTMDRRLLRKTVGMLNSVTLRVQFARLSRKDYLLIETNAPDGPVHSALVRVDLLEALGDEVEPSQAATVQTDHEVTTSLDATGSDHGASVPENEADHEIAGEPSEEEAARTGNALTSDLDATGSDCSNSVPESEADHEIAGEPHPTG